MNERKYCVLNADTKQIIAKNMALDVALLLIEAWCNKYYNEQTSFTIMPQYDEEVEQG